jgi:Collagen triple helix repeat (20 copies)
MRRLPSAGTVLGCLALILAVGVSVYAAAGSGSQPATVAPASSAAADAPSAAAAQRGKRGPRGRRGRRGLRGRVGAQGPAGPPGATGAAGSALAFAEVAGNGTIDPAVSRGIVLLSTGDGSYCLNRTDGGVANVIVSVDDIALPQGSTAVATGTQRAGAISTAGCPAGTDMAVLTRINGLIQDVGFYIAVIA